eukprot:TRINITY_DN5100_c0_g1_i2.p1 TRINITY_DN5100_c0_g1~~TRINITY_DN5100_c0_g1_i2.p1  ORF type:complete len:404 (+),score=104.29 TRINITY_DN5100_c0_g1_i2:62-1273(+)
MALPEEFSYVLIAVLISLSALFSGLTLGLMGMDILQLELIMAGSDEKDAAYARRIVPVRENGNLLLCTLLLGNVAVNSLLSIQLASLTSGAVGFVLSTTLIVLFGEIIPQALCSRHPLAVGANTVVVVRFFMLVTFAMSYPISRILDFVLGEEARSVYSKGELKRLLEIHVEEKLIDPQEQHMVAAALDFVNRKLKDVMIPLENVYKLDINRELNLELLTEIHSQGHSRIPLYDADPSNVVGVLYTKDLTLLNPKNPSSLRTILRVSDRSLLNVSMETSLTELLSLFKKGNEGHIAIVRDSQISSPASSVTQDVTEAQMSPTANRKSIHLRGKQAVGIVTLEDVIEALIQLKIEDETSKFVPNRSRNKAYLVNRSHDQSLKLSMQSLSSSSHQPHPAVQLLDE